MLFLAGSGLTKVLRKTMRLADGDISGVGLADVPPMALYVPRISAYLVSNGIGRRLGCWPACYNPD